MWLLTPSLMRGCVSWLGISQHSSLPEHSPTVVAQDIVTQIYLLILTYMVVKHLLSHDVLFVGRAF